jgi:hypothetical protein
MMTILSAIRSAPIDRLRKTWEVSFNLIIIIIIIQLSNDITLTLIFLLVGP